MSQNPVRGMMLKAVQGNIKRIAQLAVAADSEELFVLSGALESIVRRFETKASADAAREAVQ